MGRHIRSAYSPVCMDSCCEWGLQVVRGSVRQSVEDGSSYRGVSAPARNKVDHDLEITEMPLVFFSLTSHAVIQLLN